MSPIPETFRKSEKLCSKKLIADLFENGHSFFSHPFQVIWIKTGSNIQYPAQLAISVSKRLFKKAVDRNLIKRRIREAWRKNKTLLYAPLEEKKIKVVFIIIYKDKTIPAYTDTMKSVQHAIRRLVSEISSSTSNC
jgi:ribonuclease P protein component